MNETKKEKATEGEERQMEGGEINRSAVGERRQ